MDDGDDDDEEEVYDGGDYGDDNEVQCSRTDPFSRVDTLMMEICMRKMTIGIMVMMKRRMFVMMEIMVIIAKVTVPGLINSLAWIPWS